MVGSLQTPLPDAIGRTLGTAGSGVAGVVLSSLVAAVLLAGFLLATGAVAGPWAKRKVAAAFWGKIGPNRMGPGGVLIIVADAVRLLSKEVVVPEQVDRPAWDVAPLLVPFSAILGFAVIPMGDGLQLADPESGLLFVFAAASIASLGVVMAGYASNNKFSLMGAQRAVALNICYEIPLVLTAASIALIAGTLQLSEIVALQREPLLVVGGVVIPSWFAFVNPFAFVLFLVANLAEVGRNPFDLAEAPTEIVAGFMTEYSGVHFVLFYLGEFVHVFLGGAIVATLFLGGPAGPVLPGVVWFTIKIWAVFLFTQWMRATVPRLRVDQFIGIGWKGLLVLSFANLLLSAIGVGVFLA
jgi:NADH-quinone oxidoreductase subunit H